MKTKKILTIASAVAAAFLVGGALDASGQTNSVGVNFVNNGSAGVVDTNSDSLLPAETAGALGYAQANWNNLGKTGDSVANSVTLTNSAGAATSLFINWDAPGTFANSTVLSLGTADAKMMSGGIQRGWTDPVNAGPVGTNVYNTVQGDKPLVYLSGLSAWFASEGAEGYSIVAYASPGGEYWDTCDYWIQAVSGDPLAGTMVGGADLTPHYTIGYFDGSGNQFNGSYNLVGPGNTNGSAGWGPNYIVFKGLTNDAALLRTYASVNWNQACLDGIQIVPQFAEIPVAQTPTFTPASTVYALQSVTVTEAATPDPVHPALWYQWQSDNGSGGATFSDLPDATNSTYAFTPTNSASTYNLQFQVIVTNIHGAVTSSPAMLTVNPAVFPFVTKDTTPGAGETYPSSAIYTFVGGSVSFSGAFDGSRPITNVWQVDTGSGYATIPNSTNSFETLSNVQVSVTLTNLQSSDSGNYRALASNFIGSTPSTPTPVTVLADPAAPNSSQAYAYAVFTNNPAAYWRLNETTYDVTANTVQAYDYSGHNLNATYGHALYVNQAGPALPGFEPANTAVSLIQNLPESWLKAPSLNLDTNTVTICMWINPNTEATWTGLFTWVNGSDKASFGFGGNQDSGTGLVALGYTWNTNSPATYNWNSGLYPPANQWSLVSLVITPTNSTIYLYYTDVNGPHLGKAVQTITNSPEAFRGGNIWIGSSDNSSGSGILDGYIDDVAVFNTALTESQVQGLFLKAIGSTGIVPNVSDATAYPSTSVYSGQNVRLTALASGSVPVSMQWQSSSDGVTWTSISGETNSSLLVNPLMVGTVYYHMVATNAVGSGTNNPSVVSFNALPVTPPGLWTVNYQITNNLIDGGASGVGHYTGRGILGDGSFWNPMPATLGRWVGGNVTNASDFQIDGATHSGISCIIYACGANSYANVAQPDSSDLGNLFNQWVECWYSPNELQFQGVADGTYNLCLYACNGTNANSGTTFVVHDALHGDQTNGTVNATPGLPLQQGVNFVLFTNVHASGGTLSLDVMANTDVSGNTLAAFNGAQIQLVSYDPPVAGFSASATNVFVGQWFAFDDQSSGVTNVVWDFGDGSVYTNVNGTVYHGYDTPGTYTVSQTVTGPLGTDSVTKVDYITVVPVPSIGNVGMSNGELVLSGTGGIEGTQYRILTSTNVALPLASWTPVETNLFGTGGVYSYTNSSGTNGASFFILVTP